MAEQPPPTLNHFSLFSLSDAYWQLPPEKRRDLRGRWLAELRGASRAVHLYQTYPAQAGADLLVWSALVGEDSGAAREFFGKFAAAMAPVRRYLTMRDTLWGFTRPSQYTKVRSTQEIDPLGGERQPYLVMYPFVKTAEWYLKSQEERREMMFGHIKVGKQYPDITQLLLYSFGLQDQEFVVVYETADLVRFLNLVADLRGTEARLFTQRDYPLSVGIYQSDEAELATWL